MPFQRGNPGGPGKGNHIKRKQNMETITISRTDTKDPSEMTIEEFKIWKTTQYDTLSEDDQILFDRVKKWNIQSRKYKDTKISPPKTERGSLWFFEDDLSLFKQHYCRKRIIPFQERVLARIKKALADAKERGLRQVIILVLCPKRHGKTEGIVQPFLLHEIIFDRNQSYKYVSIGSRLAIAKIQPIKQLLEESKELNRDFGPFQGDLWTQGRFKCLRTRIMPDPTLEAWGMDSIFTGENTDGEVIDDPMDADMSMEVRKGIHNRFYGELLNTRTPDAWTIVIMTRKAPEDLATSLMQEACPFCDHNHTGNVVVIDEFKKAITKGDYKNPSAKVYLNADGTVKDKLIIRPQLDTYNLVIDPTNHIIDITLLGEYETLAPELFNARQLIMMYWQVGEQAFDRDFQNDPSAMGGNIFKTKWLDGSDGHPFQCFYDFNYNEVYEHMKIFTLDLALSDSPTADYTGMIEAFYDAPTQDFFQFKEFKFKKTLDEVFYAMEEEADTENPDVIIVEAIGFFAPLVEGWQRASKHNIVFIEKKLIGKVERISATMQPIFQNGRYHLKREHRSTIDEYKDFPYSKNDHILDAIQQMVKYIVIEGNGRKMRLVWDLCRCNEAR